MSKILLKSGVIFVLLSNFSIAEEPLTKGEKIERKLENIRKELDQAFAEFQKQIKDKGHKVDKDLDKSLDILQKDIQRLQKKLRD